ncbi:C-factor [Episyrphus balteatus]|uniref:C-factor n=1 Tax=Episyrphus balteatus TaxID=286459 RepID=UPI00248620EA|nr:C-factor [Episyrphus balteatus]
MKSILITGCNRGLGLGLVKTFLNLPKPPKYVFATCRNIEQAVDLKELGTQNDNLHILEIDLKHFDAYAKLVTDVSNVVKDDGLNVLFNNAGIASKSTRLNFVQADSMIDNLTTNTVVPVMMAKAFAPLINKAAKANDSLPMGLSRAAIINMSSILGSIQKNDSGGMYAYRTSKAGLNAATKSMSLDLKDGKVLCVSIHPGWVRTDMGGAKAPLDVESSTKTMVETLMSMNEAHNGGFFEHNGKPLPW